MTGALQFLEAVGVFGAGLLVRLGLFLAMVSILVIPAVLLALVLRGRAARRERALGVREVSGVPFQPDLAYAPGHLWLRGRARSAALEVGLDGLAQRLLPAVTAIETARRGARVERGDTIAVLHGGGRAIAIPAPLAGTVVGVNVRALRDPGLVKADGYGYGWLVALTPEEDLAAAHLARGEAAESWMRREATRWGRFLEERLGFGAADGGTLIAPAPWLIGEEGWRSLVAAFLRP
jgi:glycine cleavage system H protein